MLEHQMPYVSIVVPVFNKEKFLGECIDSILSQSFKNFELILVDDGSKDSSGKLCDEFAKKDERLCVIHQPNGGVTSARKTGVEAASAEWIMFVDADDKVTYDGLQRLVEVQKVDSGLDIIEGTLSFFYPDRTVKMLRNISMEKGPTYFHGHEYALSLCSLHGAFRGPCAKLIRKQVLIDTQALDIPKWITNREDVMMLTIAAKNIRKVIIIPQLVYEYRQKFDITAVSNKLSFDYWSDYLCYFEENVYNIIKEWDDVWILTQREVFGLILNLGAINHDDMSVYFCEKILPTLTAHKGILTRPQKLYVFALNKPRYMRMIMCFILNDLRVIIRFIRQNYKLAKLIICGNVK